MKGIFICLALIVAIATANISFGADVLDFKPNMLAEPFAKVQRAQYPPPGDHRLPVPQSAIFILHINPKDGQVQSITIERAAADRLFTALWLQALVTWKFKPNTVMNVRVPAMSVHGLRVGPTRGAGLHTYVP